MAKSRVALLKEAQALKKEIKAESREGLPEHEVLDSLSVSALMVAESVWGFGDRYQSWRRRLEPGDALAQRLILGALLEELLDELDARTEPRSSVDVN